MNHFRPPRATHPAGSIYLLVLASSLLVITLGVLALSLARARTEAVQLEWQRSKAVSLARSGIETAIQGASPTKEWRERYEPTPTLLRSNVDSGSLSVSVSDETDGLLADAVSDPITLTSTATVGAATQSLSVEFTPTVRALASTKNAISTGGKLSFLSSVAYINGTVHSGANIVATTSTLHALEWTSVLPFPGQFAEGSFVLAPEAPEIPVEADFDHLIAAASVITLPTSRKINGALISPSVNPFGPTNSSGIYLIDAQGRSVDLQRIRCHGTLIIRNATPKVIIGPAVHFEAFNPQLPTLIVIGNLCLATTSAPLTESGSLNLNPPSTPYNGGSDTDVTDSYASTFTGFIVVTNTFEMAETYLSVDGGIIVGGTATFLGDVRIRSRPLQGTASGMFTIDRWVRNGDSVRRRVE